MHVTVAEKEESSDDLLCVFGLICANVQHHRLELCCLSLSERRLRDDPRRRLSLACFNQRLLPRDSLQPYAFLRFSLFPRSSLLPSERRDERQMRRA